MGSRAGRLVGVSMESTHSSTIEDHTFENLRPGENITSPRMFEICDVRDSPSRHCAQQESFRPWHQDRKSPETA